MKYTRLIGTVIAFCMAVPLFAQQYKATIPYRILDDTKLIKMEEAPFSRETKKEAMYRLDYLSMPGCHFQNHMRRTKWDIAN